MKYLLLLMLFACSEQVEDTTLAQVYAIEQTATGCMYQLSGVVPYRPPMQTKFEAPCGLYKIGDQIICN